jgi:hypothetical protein
LLVRKGVLSQQDVEALRKEVAGQITSEPATPVPEPTRAAKPSAASRTR